ncbi:MAG TPA: hypothetical protein VGU25_08530 [Acidobacteriaceae bacterium]|nr:hypothetical protein [Acidobacteriaceae bacterium]
MLTGSNESCYIPGMESSGAAKMRADDLAIVDRMHEARVATPGMGDRYNVNLLLRLNNPLSTRP